MARDLDLRGKITMDGADKAADQLDQIADAGKKAEQPIELTVDAKIDRALGALDDLVTDAKKAEKAAEALGRALGPELSSKADLDKIVAGFEKAGLSLDEITAKADKLGAGLKDVAGPAGENLDTLANRARATAEDTDKLSDSARGANSALANMIGNSAQDLGELGGIAGSTGVALGQMAEYASDAALAGEGLGSSLKSMIAVAGPIAALTLIVGSITNAIGEWRAEQEAATSRTKAWGDAMRQAGDDARGIADSLRENTELLEQFDTHGDTFGDNLVENLARVGRAIPLLGDAIGDAGKGLADLIPIMDAAGFSAYDFATAVERGGKIGDDWWRQLKEGVATGKITRDQMDQLSQAISKYGIEATKAKQAQSIFNVDAAETTAILRDMSAAADPLAQFPEKWARIFQGISEGGAATDDAAAAVNELAAALDIPQTDVLKIAADQMAEMKAQAEQAANAARELNAVMSSEAWNTSAVDAAASAYQRLGEQQFGLTNIAAASSAAYDSLNAAIKENGFTFDTATEAGRANAEQIQSLYSSLIPNLSAAFADADGSMVQFRTNMNQLATQTFQSLRDQTDLTDDQIRAVMDQLGVFDDSQYQATFELLGTEDATTKLGLLSGVISSLPEDVQKRVTLAVQAGDPQAALNEIDAWAKGNPATVPSELDPSGAKAGVDAFAGGKQPTATVPTDANTKGAESGIASTKDYAARTTPVVNVKASTDTAIVTMLALNMIAAAMAPRVGITAYLRDYPSAGEIASRIGVVRVPVDAYLRSEPRITGGRS